MKKILYTGLITFFLGLSNVLSLNYGGCSYSDVSRLKSLQNNINISYDYSEENETIYFNVTINNITPDMYFYDNITDKTYYYSNTNNGEITIYNYHNESGFTGTYKFYSALNDCYGLNIGTKYYKIPAYNDFYYHPVCKEIPNFNLCQKFIENNYSYNEFMQLVEEYKNFKKDNDKEEIIIEYEKNVIDKFVDLYINYYYYFFLGIITICVVIIFIKRDKNKLKL